jgi:carbonyl reductase 1
MCDLILAHPSLTHTPITLYATSRAGSNLNIIPHNPEHNPEHKVHYASLDISSSESISSFQHILSEAGQPVDILINNGGVFLDDESTYENAVGSLNVNYRGTLEMCHMVLSHMREGSRIVSVSSVLSRLRDYSPGLQVRSRTVSTLPEVEELASEYLEAFKAGTLAERGWPVEAYGVSKALINTFTRVLASENEGVLINCCCPGWVDTVMGRKVGGSPPKKLEDGARIPVMLALGDIGGVTGIYWANDSIESKEEGKVQVW